MTSRKENMRIIACFLVAILISMGCSSSKPAAGENVDELRFGNYGGFAGSYIENMIHSNGKTFFKRKKKSKFVSGEAIAENEAKRIFTNFKMFGLDTLDLKDPGNLTYFIECKVDGKKHKLEWGGKSQKLDPKLQMFYDVIKNQVKKKEVLR